MTTVSSTSHLASPERLAALVSSVTEPMCGTRFVLDDPLLRGESLCDQMFMITLRGTQDIAVVVSCDSRGSRALGAAFLGCSEANVGATMSESVIAEMLNMVAGRISASMSYTYSVGLPRRTNLAEIAMGQTFAVEDAILLRSEGRVDLRLWILEALPQPQVERGKQDGPETQHAPPDVFRSLLRKIIPFGSRGR